MSDEFFRNFPQYHFTYQYSGTRAELCHPTLPKDGRANMNAVAFAESKGWNFSETVFWHEAIVHFYWEEGSPNSEVIISSTLLPGWWVHVHVVRDDIHGFRENLSRFAEGMSENRALTSLIQTCTLGSSPPQKDEDER